MPKTIAFAGQKGGVGKSTCAIAIAAELMARGRRVLLVDGDAEQGTARQWAAVAGRNGHAAPTTMIATGPALYGEVQAIADRFDNIVIDCPGRLDEVQLAALALADLVVFPCGDSPAEAWALARSVQLIRTAEERGAPLRAVAVLTRIDPRTDLGRKARSVLQAAGLHVLTAELHNRISFKETLAAGLGVAEYAASMGKPNDRAAEQLRALVDEIESMDAGRESPDEMEEHANGEEQAIVRRRVTAAYRVTAPAGVKR
jgi:chromosome partitioning protein